MTPEQATHIFITTGEHDVLDAAWPGRSFFDRARTADNALRTALIAEIRRRTADHSPFSFPPGFDSREFVLQKVGPMVHGLFPAQERQIVLSLFEESLLFVTDGNIEQIITEADYLSTARTIANLYLGSLDLPGLDDQRVEFVGYSEETTLYLSTAYFQDDDPFSDWVVHEGAHVFHNWKRDRAGLPASRTQEFLLEIAYAKRETFAYACEAYARILERSKGLAERRRLHAEYAATWIPGDDRVDHDELIDILAEAVRARNGWKRILQRCGSPMRCPC